MKRSQREGIISLRNVALESGRASERKYLTGRIDITNPEPTVEDLIEIEKHFGVISSRVKGGLRLYDDCIALRRWIAEDPS